MRLAVGTAAFSDSRVGPGSFVRGCRLFDKVLFKPAALLVEKVVGLMDEADGDVGRDLGWAGLGLVRCACVTTS